jgi:PAS domain S-box-containing protein
MRLDDPDIFRSISDNLQIGLYLTDRERRIVFWNREAERITGYMRHEVLGRLCRDGLLMHCDAEGRSLCCSDCPLASAMRDGMPQDGHIYLHHKSGHRVPVRVRVFPVRDAMGAIIGAAETFEEQAVLLFSARRRAMLAAHGCLDAATGLPNRAIVQSHLRESLSLFLEHHLPFGVLAIQVEQVEQFELKHSREALYAILQVLARSIIHLLGVDSFLGHWTDSQFLAVVSDSSLLELERFRRQIRDLVSCSGIQWWGDQLSVTVQVGCAIVEAEDTAESLLDRVQQSLQRHAAHDQNNRSAPASGQTLGS